MKTTIGVLMVCLFAAVDASWGQCAFQAAKGKSPCGMGAAACGAPVKVEAVEADISTDALAALLRSGVKVTLLDARSGKFDDGRRIPGAKSLAPTASAEDVAQVAGDDKDGLIVTYCASVKCPASRKLATALRNLGYVNVLEYTAGIQGWTEAGKTVVEPVKD